MTAMFENRRARSKWNIYRSTTSPDVTEILVNAYDILPHCKISSLFWYIGIPLVHTGVVIKRWNREFAFEGHRFPGVSGIYSTDPQKDPSGRPFRRVVLRDFTFRTDYELSSVLKEATQIFQGTTYDLLSCNCNHFTYFLWHKLTNKSPPAWLNRAANLARQLRCVVPRKWTTASGYARTYYEYLPEDEEDSKLLLENQVDEPVLYVAPLQGDLNYRSRGEQSRQRSVNDNRIHCIDEDNVWITFPRSDATLFRARKV